MSVDDLFQMLIRSAAAVVWVARAYQVARVRGREGSWIHRTVTTATLALVLTVVAVGGIVSTLHVVPGDWLRVAYTATSMVALVSGIVVLTGQSENRA